MRDAQFKFTEMSKGQAEFEAFFKESGNSEGMLLSRLLYSSRGTKKKSNVGTIVAVACVGTTVGIVALLWPFLSPALRKHCLPYVPATSEQVVLPCALLADVDRFETW